MKTYKLKDGTEIKETDIGTFAVVFPDKRFIIVTTWKGFAEVEIPTKGTFQLN
jgi:hypothetical protein